MPDTIETLVAEFIERREIEPELDVEAFVDAHPQRAAELRAALVDLAATESMFPATPLARPERIGEWTVLGELGRGGAGRVLRVIRDAAPGGEERALKLLAPGTVFDLRALARLSREAKALEALEHPGIVAVHEVGEGSQGPWIVMDLIEGPSLAALLEGARRGGGSPPLALATVDVDGGVTERRWRAVARFGADLAEALAAAHARGLLHRDVKPSNVLLGVDDRPVLIDFGLASADGDRTLTRTGDLIGTPHYMAPEQARGERVDVRADVWGLGALLHEMSTLRPPVDSKDPLGAIESLRRGRPTRLGDGREVPTPLARIVDRALSFRPQRRFDDVGEMGGYLRRFADGDDAPLRPSSFTERLEDAARLRPMMLPAVLGAVVLLVLGFVVLRGALRPEAPAAPGLFDLQEALTLAWVEREDAALQELGATFDGIGERAFAELARAFADAEPLPVESNDELVRAVARGEAARRDGSFDQAIAAFERASALAPRWSLPTVAMGRTAREAGDLERGISEWRAAIRLVPGSASLRRRLGKMLREAGDLDGAVECFRAAVRLEAYDWRNHAELARALAPSPEREVRVEALGVLRDAQGLAPSRSRPLRNVEAALLAGLGRSSEARAIHLSILDETPDHAPTWHNVGLTYVAESRLDEAKAAFERSLELNAADSSPHVWLARLASGDAACLPSARGDPQSALDRLRSPVEVLDHLRAALRYGTNGPHVVDEARKIVGLTSQEAELADILDELAAERPVDETNVLWRRAARDLRR